MSISRTTCTAITLLAPLVLAGWPLAQFASTRMSTTTKFFDCRILPGLTRKQSEICRQNRFAVRSAADGLREAVEECKVQFSEEKWNCTTKSEPGAMALQVASKESAFVHAFSSGAVSRAIAKACALGQIPDDCQCGDRPQQSSKSFIWAGCSEDVRYGNWFSRKFVDTNEKQRMDGRSLMNLHNNRVGRKVLAGNMRKQCKCHGVSGSCVTKTCWKTVPLLEDFAALLKKKYSKAQQVAVIPEKNELVLKPVNSRTGRSVEAGKADLVFLEKSPDFCVVNSRRGMSGTSGRECSTEEQCHNLCCGQGWRVEHRWQNEPCRCKFEWCCEVKCESCTKLVERRFCR